MNSRQMSIWDILFSSIPSNIAPYSQEILKQLFFAKNKGMNITEIRLIFKNYNDKNIRKAIDALAKRNLIYLQNTNNKEKRYVITKLGIERYEQANNVL